MKLIYILLYIISCCYILISCVTNENDIDFIDYKIYIASIKEDHNISRVDIFYNNTFNESDTILFNSFGTHTNVNNKLTYNGIYWYSNKELIWNQNSTDSLFYTAIYPATSNCRYTKNELYEEGLLKDILFCKAVSKYKDKVNIKLNHLFSLLKINLNDFPKDSIKSITLTVPATIDSIGVNNGEIYINKSESKSYTSSIDSGRVYIFVIPPIDNLTLNLKININGRIVEKSIESINYQAGYIYSCNLIHSNKEKSIKTVEDFIAFTNLINNKVYGQRKLDEFFYIENGQRVFSLANNIYFTDNDCKNLDIIGTKTENFNDIFDGKGYSLYNVNFNINSSVKALFGYIGLNGIVKNINIINSSVIFSGTSEGSLLSYRNYGLIDNCVIDSCRMETYTYSGSSFVSTYLTGIIVNTRVSNSVLKCGEKSSNSLFTKILNGKILNSCAANNLITYTSNAYIGELALNVNSNSQVSNCYVKNSNNQVKSAYKFAYSIESNATVTNCFTNSNSSLWYNSKSTVNYYTFDSNFKTENNKEDVISMLNEWIDENQQYYSNYKFRKWIEHTQTIPAILL